MTENGQILRWVQYFHQVLNCLEPRDYPANSQPLEGVFDVDTSHRAKQKVKHTNKASKDGIAASIDFIHAWDA